MQTLTAQWTNGTEPVMIAVGRMSESDVIAAIRSTAGYAAQITRTSPTEWATTDPEDESKGRVFILRDR